MTVPKHKRKQSKLEFMHNYYKIRDQMTFVLMNDFGYSRSKAEARISHKYFHNVPRAELPEPEKILFDEYLERSDRVFAEFVVSEREFDDCYRSWFRAYYKYMSKQQRSNTDALFKSLKETRYGI